MNPELERMLGGDQPEVDVPMNSEVSRMLGDSDDPEENEGFGETKKAALRGVSQILGGFFDLGGMLGKKLESMGVYDYPVLSYDDGSGFGLKPISQVSYDEAVFSSEYNAKILRRLGLDIDQSEDRSDIGQVADRAVEFIVAGGPFIAKSIATGLAKGGASLAGKTAVAEGGAALGASTGVQLAQGEGPAATLTAAIIGDVIGRKPTRALGVAGNAAIRTPGAIKRAPGAIRKSLAGPSTRARAAQEVGDAVPDPQALINTIDANPKATNIFELPDQVNTAPLAKRVASLNPEARAEMIKAAQAEQRAELTRVGARYGADVQLGEIRKGVAAAQGEVAKNVTAYVDDLNSLALQAVEAADNAIAGLNGTRAAELSIAARATVDSARASTKSILGKQFDALLSQPLRRESFVGVVRNTKKLYKGREALLPDLPQIKELHARINKLLVKQEPTPANFQALLSEISATERNILHNKVLRTQNSNTVKNYLNDLENQMLNAFESSVGVGDVSRYQKLRGQWKNFRDTYDRGPLKKFATESYAPDVDLSVLVGKGVDGASSLKNFTDLGEPAKNIAREYVKANFVRARNVISDAEFKAFMNDYSPTLDMLDIKGEVQSMQKSIRGAETATKKAASAAAEYNGNNSVFTLFTGSDPKFAVRKALQASPKDLKALWAKIAPSHAARKGFVGGVIGDFFESSSISRGETTYYSSAQMRDWVARNEEALLTIPAFGEDSIAFLKAVADKVENTMPIISSPPNISPLTASTPAAAFGAQVAGLKVLSKTGAYKGTGGGSIAIGQRFSKMIGDSTKKLQNLDQVEAILTKAVNGDLGDLKVLLKDSMTPKEASLFMKNFNKLNAGKMEAIKGAGGKIMWKFTPVGTPSLVGGASAAAGEDNGSQ